MKIHSDFMVVLYCRFLKVADISISPIHVSKKVNKLHRFPMPKEHELTDFQKAEIVALESQFSHAEIGAQLNIHPSTVTKFLQRFKSHESIENLPRSGRPRKTSETRDRWIARNAESQTHVPLKVLKDILNIDINQRTIRRRLREAGIRKWRAVNRPLLTKVHAYKRQKWARAHLH